MAPALFDQLVALWSTAPIDGKSRRTSIRREKDALKRERRHFEEAPHGRH